MRRLRLLPCLVLLVFVVGVALLRSSERRLAPVSLWTPRDRPAVAGHPDPRPVELGVQFRSEVPGEVTGVRFYKSRRNAGPHLGSLWTATGERLSMVTFEAETPSGWQVAWFPEPVRIQPGTTYVASYHTPAGYYAANPGFFGEVGKRSGPLYALPQRNGVFRYGPTSAFPTETYNSTNYWVDPIFQPYVETPPTAAQDEPPASSFSLSGPGIGPEYYTRWEHGPSADPEYFPIGVWMQDPALAKEYAALGINLFIGLWEGPNQYQFDELVAAGMPAIANQNRLSLSPRARGVIQGYLLADEPDMNQPDGTPDGGGCVLPDEINRQAAALRATDPRRPVYLNLGKGAALPDYMGRGPGCQDRGQEDFYAYATACDICSVDYYAISDPYEPPHNKGIWAYGRSIDRMREFVHDQKPVWGFVEATNIFAENDVKATPDQVRSIVWMSLIHGAKGIEYFAHSFRDGLKAEALLLDRPMASAITAINRQVLELAPVLNSPTVTDGVRVTSSTPSVGLDVMTKAHGGATYVFAIANRDGGTTAEFTVAGVGHGTVEVIGEDRAIPLSGGRFQDTFFGYQVHLYKVVQR